MPNYPRYLMALGLTCLGLPLYALGEFYALEEMVVTAQKRVETQQEVPASFSVYGADTLESAGWGNVTDMADLTPSIEVIGQTKTRTSIFIRGIGTNKYDIGTEGSVGIFVDGVYVPRFSSLMQNLVDLDRMEILRGPQGTLYGRNTIGGSVSLYSKEPQAEFQGKISGGFGNKDSNHVSVTLSGEVTENLVLYGGVTHMEEGGFREETNSHERDDQDTKAARFKASYMPSDYWESTLTVDWSKQKANAFLGEIISTNGDIFGIFPLIPQSTRDAVLAAEEDSFYDSNLNDPGFTKVKSLSIAFNVKYMTDDFNIESTTGFRDEEVQELVDNDRLSFDIFLQDTDQNSKTYSQELKISSEEGGAYSMDDNLEWLVGVFFYRDDADRSDKLNLGIDGALGGLPSLTPPILPPYFFDFLVDLETSSWAIYGQASYYFTEELSLTLGGRFSRDTKKFTYSENAVPASILANDIFSFDDTIRFESTDPKIVLEYEPLWAYDVNVYASYQQGYKSGGIQFLARRLEVAQASFDKEVLKAFETGIKTRWLDQKLQLNASIYHYDYSDQQIQAIVNFNGATQVVTTNAGESTIDGFETDLMYLIGPDFLVQASYSYIDASFDKFITPDLIDLSGNVLPATPRHAAWLSGQYTLTMNDWESTLRLDYAWRDDLVFTPDGEFGQDAYGLFNASLTLIDPNDSVTIRVECTNCADTKYRTAITPLTGNSGWQASGDRRRFGIEMEYRF